MATDASRFFPTCFRPLSSTAAGRRVVAEFGLPPFIDGSCRREPDFEARFPTVSALCRPNFAPRLQPGDVIGYFTVAGRFPDPSAQAGYRLVALLRVRQRFETHESAAAWHRVEGLPIPSNCLVPGNPPVPYHLTNQTPPAEVRERVRASGRLDATLAVRLWDRSYAARAARIGTFLVCVAERLELHVPPLFRRDDMVAVFGRVPGMRTPPTMGSAEHERLVAHLDRTFPRLAQPSMRAGS